MNIHSTLLFCTVVSFSLQSETPRWVPPTVAIAGALGSIAIVTKNNSLNGYIGGILTGLGTFFIAKKLWKRTRVGVTQELQNLVQEYNMVINELAAQLSPYDNSSDLCATLQIIHADSVWPLVEGFYRLQYLLQRGHADQLSRIHQHAQDLLERIEKNHNLPELLRIIKVLIRDSEQAYGAYTRHIRELLFTIKQHPEFLNQWKMRVTEEARQKELLLQERMASAQESVAQATWAHTIFRERPVIHTTVINNNPHNNNSTQE